MFIFIVRLSSRGDYDYVVESGVQYVALVCQIDPRAVVIQNVRFQRVPVRTSVLRLLFLNSSVRGRDSDIIVFAILQQSLDFDRHSNCVRINRSH
jgi:hypothetical protein